MINKLRKKFILINMTLVSIVMLIVFSTICISNYQWQKAESIRAMDRLIQSQNDLIPFMIEIGGKDPQNKGPMLPAFSVLLNEKHEIISAVKENVTVSDSVILKVTDKVLASGKENGTLLDMQLRYMIRQTPDGTKIAFADMGREIETLTNLISALLLIGLGGLAAFFLISMFLARWALRPTEKAWQQQQEFVANASHELKTPLTVILANTDILLSHKEDTIDKQAKWVENTKAEANRMKTLVDQLLFLAKNDAYQKETLIKSQLNFSDVVWSCLLNFEALAFEQGVTIENHIAPDITILGDEGRLKQLVVILLDNACKYAGEKGVVTVALEKVHNLAKLTVNNTGEPIPPEHLKRIFERFYRPESSRNRKEGGYGLGLAIGQTIVDNHDGKITVESNKEAGTTFTVTLPLS